MIQSVRMKPVAVVAAVLALIGGLVLMTDPQSAQARRLASFIPAIVGPWLSEADQTYDAGTIFDYIDGAGEVYRSYNMRLLTARRFHKDGRPDIVVDAFDMGTSEDAFGVFSHDLDGEDAGIGQGSTYKAGLLSFWQDRYFFSVYAEEETTETRAAVLELGRRIAEAIPGRGEPPALLRFLPADGLDAGRVRFFHNHSVLNYHFFVADSDILRLDLGADAVLATYGGKGDQSRLFVAAYPRDKLAARAGDSFLRAYMPDAAANKTVKTENGKWTGVRVVDAFVVIVFDAASEQSASSRLEAVEALIKGGRRPAP